MLKSDDVLHPGEPELASIMGAAKALMAEAVSLQASAPKVEDHPRHRAFVHAFVGLLNAAALPLDEIMISTLGMCVAQVMRHVDERDMEAAWLLLSGQATESSAEMSRRDAARGRA